MVFIRVEELENRMVFSDNSSEIIFQGTLFFKENLFPKQFRDLVQYLVKLYTKKNRKVLVIEHNLFFSLWLEKPNNQTQTRETEVEPSSKPESPAVEKQSAGNEIIMQYRGTTYKVKKPESQSHDKSSSQQRPLRKYRGNYY